jgi:hypothetical protein
MSSETYTDALNALGTLISKQRRTTGLKWEEAFTAMHIFLEVRMQELNLSEEICLLVNTHFKCHCLTKKESFFGHSSTAQFLLPCMQRLRLTDALKNLKVIHVAGTKGKVMKLISNVVEQ